MITIINRAATTTLVAICALAIGNVAMGAPSALEKAYDEVSKECPVTLEDVKFLVSAANASKDPKLGSVRALCPDGECQPYAVRVFAKAGRATALKFWDLKDVAVWRQLCRIKKENQGVDLYGISKVFTDDLDGRVIARLERVLPEMIGLTTEEAVAKTRAMSVSPGLYDFFYDMLNLNDMITNVTGHERKQMPFLANKNIAVRYLTTVATHASELEMQKSMTADEYKLLMAMVAIPNVAAFVKKLKLSALWQATEIASQVEKATRESMEEVFLVGHPSQCTVPVSNISIPDGTKAGKEEMLAAQNKVKAYDAKVAEYGECLRKARDWELTTAGNELTKDQRTAIVDSYLKKGDKEVDKARVLANAFNAELKQYKLQQDKLQLTAEADRLAREAQDKATEAARVRLAAEEARNQQLAAQKKAEAERTTALQQAIVPTMSIDTAKGKCAELGFKAGTEDFGKCVLQLTK